MEQEPAEASETLVAAALRVLNTADPFEKARLGDSVATRWLQGRIGSPYDAAVDLPVPDRPARLTDVRALHVCSEVCALSFDEMSDD